MAPQNGDHHRALVLGSVPVMECCSWAPAYKRVFSLAFQVNP